MNRTAVDFIREYREQMATPSLPYSFHILSVSLRNSCQQLT
jgi:hypothetical protein